MVNSLVCLGGPLHNSIFSAEGVEFNTPMNFPKMPHQVGGIMEGGSIEVFTYQLRDIQFSSDGKDFCVKKYWVLKGTTDRELPQLLGVTPS